MTSRSDPLFEPNSPAGRRSGSGRAHWLVLAAAIPVLHLAVVRPWLLAWGATPEEVAGPLPGDEMVPDPLMQTTRAIDIEASRAEVWPWLAQMGYGRAGWYSYDPLEKIAGAGEFAEVRSADRILPQFQDLRVGDLLPVAPDVGWFTAASVDPHRCLALRATMNPLTGKAIATTEPMSEPWFDASWVFLLQEPVAGMTRLVVRFRARYGPRWNVAPLALAVLDPAHFLMERKMLRGIKERAEKTRRAGWMGGRNEFSPSHSQPERGRTADPSPRSTSRASVE